MIRLKELRNKIKYTQKDTAEYLGISQPAYANYENESRQADYDTLSKLATLFNVSVDYILGRTEERRPHTNGDDITFDDFSYAMHNETRELSDADKQMLLDMARVMKKRVEEKNRIENDSTE